MILVAAYHNSKKKREEEEVVVVVVVRNVNVITHNSSTRQTVGLYWVPGHAGVRGIEIADKLTRGSSA